MAPSMQITWFCMGRCLPDSGAACIRDHVGLLWKVSARVFCRSGLSAGPSQSNSSTSLLFSGALMQTKSYCH